MKNNILRPLVMVPLMALTMFRHNSGVSAANACTENPNDYCLGTTSWDAPDGCYRVGNSCVTSYHRTVQTCNLDTCRWEVNNSPVPVTRECINATPNEEGQCLGHSPSHSGSCCVNLGDGNDDDDIPSNPAQCGATCGEGTKAPEGVNVSWEDHNICDTAGLSCGSWHGSSGACDTTGEHCFKVCWSSDVCGKGDDDDDTPINYPICGNISGSDGNPIPNISVKIQKLTTTGIDEMYTTADDQGFFTTPNGFIMSDEHVKYWVTPQ